MMNHGILPGGRPALETISKPLKILELITVVNLLLTHDIR